ncbi:hypothetical protein ASC77_02530 [Nocardioides sp. Root1257]|uniref:hypothetical protein n=1 Tax=unclassified Nocardioides TaxID=2615069 RepID=UPI0006FD5DA1|nr:MULTISPECIES: hypothetical protein [unclassified Nocardioides]KQW53191.1 hypothetical protein ASC77_02530 [Nocardioides sp. Root1257]KRC55878.1 hypothetical protein ASE24_02530 [Nocardioides sp. Root224]
MTKGAAVLLTVLLASAACGDAGSTTGTDPAPAASPTGTPPTPTTEPTEDAVSGGEAADAILDESRLPAGWRYATGEQTLGVPEMCGVVLEPPALSSFATQRFTADFAGPFVIQHSFVSSDESASAERMAAWAEAAATCTTWTTEGTELTVSTIADLPSVGEDFGAVHAEVERDGVVQQRDYVAWRDGARVTVLIAYGATDLPTHAELAEMITAIAGH